jgi:hypothetical protein
MRAFLERHFELFDVATITLASVGIFIWGHWFDHDTSALRVLNGNRTGVYGAIAALFGTIFGFAMMAMSIIFAFADSPRLTVLRRSRHWLTFWRMFTQGLRIFIGVAMLAIAAMIFDRDRSPNALLIYGLIFAVFLGTARLYRIIWAFEKLVLIMTQPDRVDLEGRVHMIRKETVPVD